THQDGSQARLDAVLLKKRRGLGGDLRLHRLRQLFAVKHGGGHGTLPPKFPVNLPRKTGFYSSSYSADRRRGGRSSSSSSSYSSSRRIRPLGGPAKPSATVGKNITITRATP